MNIPSRRSVVSILTYCVITAVGQGKKHEYGVIHWTMFSLLARQANTVSLPIGKSTNNLDKGGHNAA
jgi:hypothetical protein